MKPIQPYKKEALTKLKQWISEMNAHGHEQYYEIFVDVTKVLHKTKDTNDFESYLTWVDEDTQLIKVLTYNTKGSHRAKVFEYRTEQFVEKVNYKDQLALLQNTNEELLKRIADAEEHINNLEAQSEQSSNKPGFDIEKIISTFGAVTKQYPDLADKFGGFGDFFKTASKQEEKNEDFECTFKKKATQDTQKEPEPDLANVPKQNETDTDDVFTFSTVGKLGDQHAARMYELMQFFAENTDYVDVVYDMVSEVTKGKIE